MFNRGEISAVLETRSVSSRSNAGFCNWARSMDSTKSVDKTIHGLQCNRRQNGRHRYCHSSILSERSFTIGCCFQRFHFFTLGLCTQIMQMKSQLAERIWVIIVKVQCRTGNLKILKLAAEFSRQLPDIVNPVNAVKIIFNSDVIYCDLCVGIISPVVFRVISGAAWLCA